MTRCVGTDVIVRLRLRVVLSPVQGGDRRAVGHEMAEDGLQIPGEPLLAAKVNVGPVVDTSYAGSNRPLTGLA